MLEEIKYTLTENNLHIEDSFKVRKREMKAVLLHIFLAEYGSLSKVWQRSSFSLQMEWIVHNFCYSLGIAKERTKDVDLDNPCNLPEWVYEIIGVLVWIFVK